jgi:hypothetical protein
MSWHDPRDDYDDEPWKGRFSIERLLKPTTDVMWSFGVFQLAVSLLGILLVVGGLFERWTEGPPVTWTDFWRGLLLATIGAVGIVTSLIVMRGSHFMKRFDKYSIAIAAAILTIFSLPCIYAAPFGIPIGLWAVYILRRRDIRARFDAVASDHNMLNGSTST